MKVEIWNGHAIRFVEKDGAWWAVAADICEALEIEDTGKAVKQTESRLQEADIYDPISNRIKLPVKNYSGKGSKTQEMVCISETGIYELAMGSRKKEAVAFRHWVCKLLVKIREAMGYEQYRTMIFMESVHNHNLNMDLIVEQAWNTPEMAPVRGLQAAQKIIEKNTVLKEINQ